MKKTAIFLILLLSIPGFSGCGGSQNPASAVTAEEGMTSAENGGDTDEKNWSSQEILSMFENVKEDCWSVAGCVPISDDAYDRVGAVLFYDSETETSNTAFFDEEGNYQMCGVSAKIYSEPDFTYHGDGVVTFIWRRRKVLLTAVRSRSQPTAARCSLCARTAGQSGGKTVPLSEIS